MPETKHFDFAYTTGYTTLVLRVKRMADTFWLNDADGAFAVAPADPYVAMTESPASSGIYILDESRAAWNDGQYYFYVYDGTTIISDPGEIWIINDKEIDYNCLEELYAANLPADIDALIARLTAVRAGYLDNLAGGPVALASVCTNTRLTELDAANIPQSISSLDTLLDRIIGIVGENQYVDNYAYTDGKLTSARLRIYSVAGSVGTANNVVATYTITQTYGVSGAATLSIVKV